MTKFLFIHGEITEASGKVFVANLSELPATEPVTISINSIGGNVAAADAIVAAIQRRKGRVKARVDALAASAASYVAMFCSEVVMAPGSYFMIHCPSAIDVTGTKDYFQRVADHLGKLELRYANAYAARSRVPVEAVLDWMKAETWLSAEEAVTAGLADRVDHSLPMATEVGPEVLSIGFKHVPAAVKAMAKPLRPATFRTKAQRDRRRRRMRIIAWHLTDNPVEKEAREREEKRLAAQHCLEKVSAEIAIEEAIERARLVKIAEDRRRRDYAATFLNVPRTQIT